MPPLMQMSEESPTATAVTKEGGTVAATLVQASARCSSARLASVGVISEPARTPVAERTPLAAERSWQSLLAESISEVDELWRVLGLPPSALPAARAAAGSFRLLVPRGFAAAMRPGDLADPLLRQVLPVGEELVTVPGYSSDPLAETQCTPVPGMLHKYHGRALMVVTGACAVHCRYCFRRHYPYEDLPRGRQWWTPSIAWLHDQRDIHEVLLSGGDPLTLPDAQLAALAADLATVPQLTRLRIHSRLPIVLPERIDAAFLQWFTAGRLAPVLVVHCNHPQELTPAVVAACQRLRDAGVTVLSQAVLLQGVNDSADTLVELSEKLFAAGVIPYYLHLLDRVQGAHHFMVTDDRAKDVMRAVAARLPGYLVPRLVREEAGAEGKTPVRW